jgi:tetratricopeptide (TPR) repeat protein
VLLVTVLVAEGLYASDALPVGPEKLLKAGQELAENSHYLEALDLLEEARDILENNGPPQSSIYGDVLFTIAQTKIKGRLHQNFSAYYVKSALHEIQAANKLRERLPDTMPQRLAEGYYLEGYIQKRFFMRNNQALACFTKAVNIDPGLAAAKRELSDLITEESK